MDPDDHISHSSSRLVRAVRSRLASNYSLNKGLSIQESESHSAICKSVLSLFVSTCAQFLRISQLRCPFQIPKASQQTPTSPNPSAMGHLSVRVMSLAYRLSRAQTNCGRLSAPNPRIREAVIHCAIRRTCHARAEGGAQKRLGCGSMASQWRKNMTGQRGLA